MSDITVKRENFTGSGLAILAAVAVTIAAFIVVRPSVDRDAPPASTERADTPSANDTRGASAVARDPSLNVPTGGVPAPSAPISPSQPMPQPPRG